MVRYIQGQEERRKILHACHVHPTSGHLGVYKTSDRISERFTWLGYTRDVEDMVSI